MSPKGTFFKTSPVREQSGSDAPATLTGHTDVNHIVLLSESGFVVKQDVDASNPSRHGFDLVL